MLVTLTFEKDGIDYKVYLASDPSTPVQMEFKLPHYDADGLVDFTVDVSDIAPGDTIVGIDLFSINNSKLGTASFLLNNVTAEYPGNMADCVEDQFDYVLTDGDQDTSTASLTIKTDIVNDMPEIISVDNLVVDETDFNAGLVTADGQVTADFFGDNPGVFSATGQTSFSANTALTSNGLAVTVALIGGAYVGLDENDTEVFTLELNADGTYSFELKETPNSAENTFANELCYVSFLTMKMYAYN